MKIRFYTKVPFWIIVVLIGILLFVCINSGVSITDFLKCFFFSDNCGVLK